MREQLVQVYADMVMYNNWDLDTDVPADYREDVKKVLTERGYYEVERQI